MPPALPLGGGVESTAAAAAASAANAAAHAAAAAVMNQPVASVQASTETMEQVGFALCECCMRAAWHLGPNQVVHQLIHTAQVRCANSMRAKAQLLLKQLAMRD